MKKPKITFDEYTTKVGKIVKKKNLEVHEKLMELIDITRKHEVIYKTTGSKTTKRK
jgi:hypothetical protein